MWDWLGRPGLSDAAAPTKNEWSAGAASQLQYCAALIVLGASLSIGSVVSVLRAQTAHTVAQKALPSVVLLSMEDTRGKITSLGSGFFIRRDVIATNLHVIEGAANGYARVVGQKTKYQIAGIVGVDRARDLVLLRITGVGAPPLPLGDSHQVAVGDTVFVVGNPEGLEGTFSQGIISAIRQLGTETFLQITAPISPGNSGGPVLDARGRVIGVAVGALRRGQNLNFAIPVSYVASLLADMTPVRPLRAGMGRSQPRAIGRKQPQAEPTPSARGATVDPQLQRCAQLANTGPYLEAERECRAAEAGASSIGYHSMIHYCLGKALTGQKRWDGAIAEFRESMILSGKEDWSIHLGIGDALRGKGDLDGAIAEYRLALRTFEPLEPLAPGTPAEKFARSIDLTELGTIHMTLGYALFEKNDIAGAIAEFRELVRLNPATGLYHNFLGFLLEVNGDSSAALEEYRTAHELDPKDAEFRADYERLLRTLEP